jgi:hypothetical protein
MSTMPSDIQVFVRFKEPSVFAGEELDCTITFKNVASEQYDASPLDTKSGRHNRRVSLAEQSAMTPRGNNAGWSKENPRLTTAALHSARSNISRGHRATASLSIPKSSGTPIGTPSTPYREKAVVRPSPNHQRSVSIISAARSANPTPHVARMFYQLPPYSSSQLTLH